ncbi:MAG TPA: aminotransferase class V-fold PLP-dependent enzyme [Longimicrobiaceae bacterium]|nr:aminotransferase class V-fold PLP-dependent enzyme [Longimicrobiaceae bacterium]
MGHAATLAAPGLAELRAREFPSLAGAAYLNAASVTPTPERTRRVLDALNRRRTDITGWTDDDFTAPLDAARAAAARLVGADADEIALGWNTSFGINLAAQCLPIPPGSTVVVSDREFPANVYPWMGPGCPGRLETVPADPLGRPDEERLLERLDRGDVSVLSVSAVQFATGWRADLPRLGRFCRERGIFFVVDAIQALGQLPLDVREAEVDVLATGAQKWLCGPFGTGFAYVRRELLSRMQPAVVGWTSLRASADFGNLLDYRYDFVESARRFEVGTPAFQDFAGMAASLEVLLEAGIAEVQAHVAGLLEPLEGWLADRPGYEVVSDRSPARRSGILCFRPPEPEAAFAALAAAGVACVLREGAVRLSPHLYNDADDLARVLEVLEREVAR